MNWMGGDFGNKCYRYQATTGPALQRSEYRYRYGMFTYCTSIKYDPKALPITLGVDKVASHA